MNQNQIKKLPNEGIDITDLEILDFILDYLEGDRWMESRFDELRPENTKYITRENLLEAIKTKIQSDKICLAGRQMGKTETIQKITEFKWNLSK